jgi:hypothetical protein
VVGDLVETVVRDFTDAVVEDTGRTDFNVLAGALTPQERKRHQEEGLCFKYHKKGTPSLQVPDIIGQTLVDTLNKQKRWWHGFSSDELEQLATSTCHHETLLAIEVQLPSSTLP